MSETITAEFVTSPLTIEIPAAMGPAGPTGAQGPAGTSVWGSITGTLDNQADLAARLRYRDSGYNLDLGLRLWRAALANAPQTAVNLVLIGDSITAGSNATSYALSFGQQLKKWFQAKYGAGNEETLWRVASNGGTTNPDTRWTLTSGSWAEASQGGIAGKALSSSNSADRLTISNLYGDTLEIFTVNNPNTSGSFAVTIDGGADNNISQSTTASLASATVVRNTVSMGSLGNHTVVIKGPSSGSLYVAAVSGRIGSTGVRFYPFALSAAQSSDWSSATDNRDQAIAAFTPNLVIVAVNVNDYHFQVSKATFKANIERIVTEAQAVNSSVLLLIENPDGDIDGGGSPLIAQTEYRAALLELADTYPNHVAVLDMYTRWISHAGGVADGLIADTVHPTQKGHSDYYRALLDAIVTGDAGSNPTLAATFDGAMRITNLGVDNVRVGVFSGTPGIFLENAGVVTWNIDAAGASTGLRFVKDNATVPVQWDGSGNMTILGNITASGTGNTKFNTGGGSFGIGVAGTPSGLQVGTAVSTSALAVNNVRLGMNSSAPSVFLETTASGGSRWNIDNASGVFRFVHNAATVPLQLSTTELTFANAVNIVLGTGAGSKIGTATGQKLGFWNAAPVVQQVLATGAGATVDNVISLLQTLGLCKQA